MSTASFTKEMKLNKADTERLIDILESKSKNTYKINTPAAKKASKKFIREAFADKLK